MKHSKSYREVGLMVLPAMLLLGAGLYGNRLTDNLRLPFALGPYRLVLDSLKVVPAAPLDVARGYDTVVEMEASPQGKLPVNAGPQTMSSVQLYPLKLYVGENSRPLTGQSIYPELTSGDTYRSRILLKLADLPASTEAVSLRGKLVRKYSYQSKQKRVNQAYELPFSIVVRPSQHVVKTPNVSPSCPIRVLNTTTDTVTVVSSKTKRRVEKRLFLHLSALNTETETFVFRPVEPRLLSEEHGRFIDVSSGQSGLNIYPSQYFKVGWEAHPHLATFAYYNVDAKLAGLPGTLWIETSFSVNGSWPLRVRLLIRRSKPSDPKIGTVRSEVWPSKVGKTGGNKPV